MKKFVVFLCYIPFKRHLTSSIIVEFLCFCDYPRAWVNWLCGVFFILLTMWSYSSSQITFQKVLLPFENYARRASSFGSLLTLTHVYTPSGAVFKSFEELLKLVSPLLSLILVELIVSGNFRISGKVSNFLCGFRLRLWEGMHPFSLNRIRN